ncbi:MAG TPA: (Fe-S)-binding protein [Acidimicrobiales bacterium]|nr:(Fe-S)-binding protein [Acidimicrobiales bacterium]
MSTGPTAGAGLSLDPEDLSRCVSCGLCLPHCPTFRATGEEPASPRGRIAAMRAVAAGAPADPRFVEVIDSCVLCRGCETACPSGVPFGSLMESTRSQLATAGLYTPRRMRPLYGLLGRHRLLLALSTAAALAQRVGAVPGRFGLPRLPLWRAPLVPTGDDVWLFTGCVMDAWMRSVHADAIFVLTAAGAGVRPTPAGAACCGALSLHAGLADQARRMAGAVVRALPGDAPVLVDSAGCGAALKEYGGLLGGAEGERFAARVLDVHEWLAAHPPPAADPLPVTVAVVDPCHLRHVQRAHSAVRAVLAPYVAAVVELDDEGLCCGAGGAYSATHPETADLIRRRKLAAISRAGADVVVAANPGCAMHLRAGGVEVLHPLELVAEALRRSGG